MITSQPCENPIALVALFRSANIFDGLRDDELEQLAGRMSTVLLDDEEVLVEQGATSDQLFIVLSGVLSVSARDRNGSVHLLADLGAGRLVGGMNVFSAAPSPATIRARGAVEIASLSKAALAQFTESCPSGELTLMEALRPQLCRDRLWAALHASDMFRDVERPVLVDVESEFEPVALYGGEVLFRQGAPGDSLFIVVSGRLRVVSIGADGSEALLAELGPGETVGEMGVISGEPRSATVYAARDTQLAKLSRASVDRVIHRHPRSMLRMLAGQLVSRLRNASNGTTKRALVGTIAVVPASADAPLAEFAAHLTTALSRLGRTLHLTSDVVDARCGRSGASQAHDREGGSTGLLEWLAEQELEYRYVVYQADRVLSPWTERCVRQADRVVLVADAAGHAGVGEVEGELLTGQRATRTPVTLALSHRADGVPSGTGRWLAGRTLERHLHVRRGVSADYDRVARFITGTAVGLALGGGFARGLAHLGILRALQELNIPVDAIGGASMGAMVGAQWMLGWEPSRIVREMSSAFAESFDDMTIPFLAFKRGGKASKVVRRFFQESCIEDMWMPYFCVSANLNRSELKIHTAGRVADAVLASSRAPGIFPPVVIDGELHVDGGLINNVPVDVMKSFSGGGVVIGVDVSPPHELNPVDDYGHDLSGWQAIWHRFNPSPGKRIYRPSMLLVLMRIIEFGGISYRREKAALADVYISPDVLRFKRNDFHAASAIAEAGYTAAREALGVWLATAPESMRLRRPDLFQSAPASSRLVREAPGARSSEPEC